MCSFLNQCRPLSVSQGNVVNWFKKLLNERLGTPREAESGLKQYLMHALTDYFQDNIITADRSIALNARTKIDDGDTILTFGLYY